jgi:hypothetical protein
MQDNIWDQLELDEGDPDFSFWQRKKLLPCFFLFIFITTTYIIKFSMYLFSKFFLSFMLMFCFINLDYRLIRIREGLLYVQYSEKCYVSVKNNY